MREPGIKKKKKRNEMCSDEKVCVLVNRSDLSCGHTLTRILGSLGSSS